MASRNNSVFVVLYSFIKVFWSTDLRSQEVKLVVFRLIHVVEFRCWNSIFKVDLRSVLLIICYSLLKLGQNACSCADVGASYGWTVCRGLSFLYVLKVLLCYFWKTHIIRHTRFPFIFHFVQMRLQLLL